MNFELTSEQVLLRDSARKALARWAGADRLRKSCDDARQWADDAGSAWAAISEMGWPALLVDGDRDGSGLACAESCILHEELGGMLFTGPFTATAVLAAALLQHRDCPAPASQLLDRIVTGQARFSCIQLPPADAGLLAGPAERAWDLALAPVQDIAIATHFLMWAQDTTAKGNVRIAVAVLERTAPGVRLEAARAMDPSHSLGRLELHQVVPPAPWRFTLELTQREALLLQAGPILAACAEQVGLAARALAATVTFVTGREQFGRPVGSFQALKHKLADAHLQLTHARNATACAAWCCDHPEGLATGEIAMKVWSAQALSGEMGPRVTSDCIQCHGAMGFTWDSDMHLYFKRARRLVASGEPLHLVRRRIAQALLKPAPSIPEGVLR